MRGNKKNEVKIQAMNPKKSKLASQFCHTVRVATTTPLCELPRISDDVMNSRCHLGRTRNVRTQTGLITVLTSSSSHGGAWRREVDTVSKLRYENVTVWLAS